MIGDNVLIVVICLIPTEFSWRSDDDIIMLFVFYFVCLTINAVLYFGRVLYTQNIITSELRHSYYRAQRY